MPENKVKVWSERIAIPTYGIGKPDKNPMFLEKRVYQGSSGAVYPHPVIDSVSDVKEDKEYTAVFLENQWLKIMILPELGGRVQMALDKTNGYHFVYYNQAIKPALVGLCGPWISGGIEFNWPQHHRPSTFQPVMWKIEDNEDGSATVWCSEIEKMFRTQGTHGFTLHPDRAVLQVDVRLYNRTDVPQTFLWWANPAVHVNDDYQSVFPPDVHAVMDHGKRAVSDFPIATGEYYRVNYAPGTDISRYKNIPVPTSFMAYHSDYDFIGCYDHGKRAGMVHVANHHLVPGKKQWTWGTSDFGQAWDRQLTDEDGPYIELMCGAFTDNQPDFSWLMPGEEKRFTQYFYPYKEIGPPVNASEDCAFAFSVEGDKASLGLYAARNGRFSVELWRNNGKRSRQRNHINLEFASIADGLSVEEEMLFSEEIDLEIADTWMRVVELKDGIEPTRLTVIIRDEDGRTALSYSPQLVEIPDTPLPAKAALHHSKIASNEELYLNGLHLEQYRHATYDPEDYYLECLRRDPGDSRCNNAMGLLLHRRGKFAEAERYFRLAIERLTLRNPNPRDGELYYNLGISLVMQSRLGEAEDAFWKATWNEAFNIPARFELARLALRRGERAQFLEHLAQGQLHNMNHSGFNHLSAILARLDGDYSDDPLIAADDSGFDSDNAGVQYEAFRRGADNGFPKRMGRDPFPWIEIALDYARAGQFGDALELIRLAPSGDRMADYFAGWIGLQMNDETIATSRFAAAAAQLGDFAFPNQVECVPALQAAIAFNSADALAPYALGNFWYAHKQYEDAIACWEMSRDRDPEFPTVWRNLGLAYMNKRNDPARAREAFEKAITLDRGDARVFFELDQLLKKTNVDPAERLARLEAEAELCERRDDLTIERIALMNFAGRHSEALELLMKRKFHPWEGGEGKVTGQYVLSLVELAKRDLAAGRHQEALGKLERARSYPHNLGEGKLYGARENHLDYWTGRAHAAAGDGAAAKAAFEKASRGSTQPDSAQYYNDQPPDMIFYQGLAMAALAHKEAADGIFRGLVDYAKEHLSDEAKIDYFAVSLPDFLVFDDDLQKRHEAHCYYMAGLGKLGLEAQAGALEAFGEIIARQADHLGAAIHSRFPRH